MEKSKNKIAKLPKGVTYNPELDKYANQVLFPNKVEKANEILKKFGPPKI